MLENTLWSFSTITFTYLKSLIGKIFWIEQFLIFFQDSIIMN